MLHSKVLEMLEGTEYGTLLKDRRAGKDIRERIGRWAMMYFGRCCTVRWETTDTFVIILESPDKVHALDVSLDKPTDVWKLYTDATMKLEEAVLGPARPTKILPSIRNSRMLHTVATWLVQEALMKKDLTDLLGLNPGQEAIARAQVASMQFQMIEAARERLIVAVKHRLILSKADPDKIEMIVRILHQQHSELFLPHTLDIWKHAESIAGGLTVYHIGNHAQAQAQAGT